MKNIKIKLRTPTEMGRMYYTPDPQIEPHILYIQNKMSRRQIFSINIDNKLLFGIDNGHLLKSIELLIPRKAWVVKSRISKPDPMESADLEILNLGDPSIFLELPVIVKTDNEYSYAQISWSEHILDVYWVSLSEQCFAGIADNYLQSIFINLHDSKADA